MFEVVLSPEVTAFYADADGPLARKLARCFEQLERDPHYHGNIKRLTGDMAGLYGYRPGDWRVLYRVEDQAKRVVVLVVAHRREAYE